MKQHSRSSTGSLKKWVEELSTDPDKLKMMQKTIDQIADEDLITFGYPKETLWKPMEEVQGVKIQPKKQKLNRYLLQRKTIIFLREQARHHTFFRKLLEKIRLACDVLLRE